MYWGLCVFIAAVGIYLAWKKAPSPGDESA